MKRFKFSGTVRIEYTYHVADEVIEVENDESEADAITALCQDLEPNEAFDTEWDTAGLDIEELDENDEDITAQRQRERALLLAWNSGQPIAAR